MLIGLTGKKQAGKDTVYARTREMYRDVTEAGMPVERASFADLLYQSAAASLGLDVWELRAIKAAPNIELVLYDRDMGTGSCLGTIREYLQRYGTEAHRDVFGQDFWVERLDLKHRGRIVLVTDVRFPNEARHVRACGGYVVRVVGPADVENAGDGHASEAGLPDDLIDDTICNGVRDDDFVSLDTQLDHLLRRLFKRAGDRA